MLHEIGELIGLNGLQVLGGEPRCRGGVRARGRGMTQGAGLHRDPRHVRTILQGTQGGGERCGSRGLDLVRGQLGRQGRQPQAGGRLATGLIPQEAGSRERRGRQGVTPSAPGTARNPTV